MTVWLAISIVATLSALVIAGSLGVIAYMVVSYMSGESEITRSKKLDAYEEVMEAIVNLNRVAVEIGEDRFHQEADKLLMDKETRLEEPHAEVSATYQRYYYLLEEDVYEAASDYVDYLVKYHDEGASVSKLLTLGGDVGAAMRKDLGKPPLGGREMSDDLNFPE